MPPSENLTAVDLRQRGHSLRNFEPSDFRAVAANEGKQAARAALSFVEDGRFEPVLSATQRMYRALDGDEREAFARSNPELMEWVNVWGFLEEVGEFDLPGPTSKPPASETPAMSSSDDACARATLAAIEVIQENCNGEDGTVREIGDGVFAFVPDDAQAEFDFDLNSPQGDREREQAIESCMDSEYAQDWAASVVGEDAPAEVDERARRRVCEGLFS